MPEAPEQMLEDGYVYAYPLVLLDLLRETVTNVEVPSSDQAPINQLFHGRTLSTPELTNLTRPNVDTLYSQTYLDLGEQPQLLRKPGSSRFCSVQTFDAYSETPFLLGSGGDAGMDDEGETTYAFTGPRFVGTLPEGVVHVPMPTDLVWLLIRIRCVDSEDLPAAHAVQDAFDLRPLSAADDLTWTPPRGTHVPGGSFIATQRIEQLGVQEFFDRFNALAVRNPGHQADAPMLELIAPLGVGAGLTFDLTSLPVEAQERATSLPTLLDQAYSSSHTPMTVRQGWMFMDSTVAHFGTDYPFRAVVARGGFANPVRLTTYPAKVFGEDGEFLVGDGDYSMHFEADELPPFLAGGWWSLTSYTLSGALIPNELDRYVVGNETGLVPNPDGSLDLWLSAEKPGDERLANWLPIDAGLFSLVMRVYTPTEAVLDGTWSPPVLVKNARG